MTVLPAACTGLPEGTTPEIWWADPVKPPYNPAHQSLLKRYLYCIKPASHLPCTNFTYTASLVNGGSRNT